VEEKGDSRGGCQLRDSELFVALAAQEGRWKKGKREIEVIPSRLTADSFF
jgi:hypothetical protein